MARPKKSDPEKRKKILAISEKIFAAKGFDGARVDDIAKKAKVNKALIYYYFKNKDAILEELYKNFIAQCMERSVIAFENIENIMSEKYVHEFFYTTIEFLESNKNILRIVLMESLKKTRQVPLLIKALDPDNTIYASVRFKKIVSQMRGKGIQIDSDVQKALVSEFFTKSAPAIFFILFHKAWSDYFKIEESDLKEWFIKAIESTHVAYHRSIQLPPKGG